MPCHYERDATPFQVTGVHCAEPIRRKLHGTRAIAEFKSLSALSEDLELRFTLRQPHEPRLWLETDDTTGRTAAMLVLFPRFRQSADESELKPPQDEESVAATTALEKAAKDGKRLGHGEISGEIIFVVDQSHSMRGTPLSDAR